ncbi:MULTISPECIES: hypothetical protein [Calothrix]|uniref:Uncharacterized protein n=2 Tax=Calothrix TaxID=1186 RepID=A0ABR8AK48_9CYAN|nr:MULTISPECIES: hypothetical protein [Calothrix]MBD2200356.1 hypothetical protein [Calothrix parietina FACHB-288]MBD2229010.1 hypothetical protein [Calothrix anomala FACHB-343]
MKRSSKKYFGVCIALTALTTVSIPVNAQTNDGKLYADGSSIEEFVRNVIEKNSETIQEVAEKLPPPKQGLYTPEQLLKMGSQALKDQKHKEAESHFLWQKCY